MRRYAVIVLGMLWSGAAFAPPPNDVIFQGKISGIEFRVVLGNLFDQLSEVLVVPQFRRNIADKGVTAEALKYTNFQNFKAKLSNDPLEFGTAVLDPLNETQSVISVVEQDGGLTRFGEAPDENQKATGFDRVVRSAFNAMTLAEKKQKRTVAFPTLGAGVLGALKTAESVAAIAAAMKGGFSNIDEVRVVIYQPNNPGSKSEEVTVRDQWRSAINPVLRHSKYLLLADRHLAKAKERSNAEPAFQYDWKGMHRKYNGHREPQLPILIAEDTTETPQTPPSAKRSWPIQFCISTFKWLLDS